jgi:hypothetical protein
MRSTVCPFCGVVSDSPHDSQKACIEALQSEIQTTRRVLTQVGESGLPGGRPDAPNRGTEQPEENADGT